VLDFCFTHVDKAGLVSSGKSEGTDFEKGLRLEKYASQFRNQSLSSLVAVFAINNTVFLHQSGSSVE
jgi:hypothetical protein